LDECGTKIGNNRRGIFMIGNSVVVGISPFQTLADCECQKKECQKGCVTRLGAAAAGVTVVVGETAKHAVAAAAVALLRTHVQSSVGAVLGVRKRGMLGIIIIRKGIQQLSHLLVKDCERSVVVVSGGFANRSSTRRARRFRSTHIRLGYFPSIRTRIVVVAIFQYGMDSSTVFGTIQQESSKRVFLQEQAFTNVIFLAILRHVPQDALRLFAMGS
jgi:hypothetical protein